MHFTAPSCLGTLTFFAALLDTALALESATWSPWLPASFTFTWTPPGVNVSVPTTAQCDTINITWVPTNDGSPDPIPPYFLQIYTSTLTYPIYVDAGTFSPFQWVVPFAPDTQYQICMFDSKGRSGGCQAAYTVMPPKTPTQQCNTTSTITNTNTLSVAGATENGPLTEYGWPDQCTSLSLTAQNGTPPFTMTVAPSLHPPFNLTFNDMGPMNWTITLGWGMQFWMSLVDSKGASWAFGPLHSGGNGPTDCLHLAGNSLKTQPSIPVSHRVSVGAAVGIAIGALVFGMIFTLAIQWILAYMRRGTTTHASEHENTPGMRRVPSIAGVEPYQIEARSTEGENTITSQRNDSQLYVVHHDGGGAPITIFTGGRDVQELPPHYTGTSPEPRPSHTPSASIDSSGQPSSGPRLPKQNPPKRAASG